MKVGNATSNKGQIPRFFQALRDILPADGLLVSDEERRPYECDGLTGYRELPLAVAMPDQLDQVEQILSLCDAQGVPVIARGAGTGLSGGATPRRDALLLSMARFSRIIDVDPVGRTARVEPGVRNLGSGCAVRALLCAGPFITDCLHDRWQCCRKFWRGALP